MVSPGVFIPVLEENGIISKLDKIVLEKVCEWLRSWMDKGFKVMMDDFGCGEYTEFSKLTGNSFKGMIHPDDLRRVENEIDRQIKTSDNNMDYIKYRIIRKDGSVRWIEDFGHLENSGLMAESGYYYVFITDITDTITEAQKNHIYMRNKYYNNPQLLNK